MTTRYKFVIAIESQKNLCGYEDREVEGTGSSLDDDILTIYKGTRMDDGYVVFNFARVLFYSVTPIEEEPA